MIANNISHRAIYHIIFFAFIMLFVSIASTSEAQTSVDNICDIPGASIEQDGSGWAAHRLERQISY